MSASPSFTGFIIWFPGPINFSTGSGSEESRGEEVAVFPRYVESSVLRGHGDTSGDDKTVHFGE